MKHHHDRNETLTIEKKSGIHLPQDAPLRAGIAPTVTASRGAEDQTGLNRSKPSPRPDGSTMPSTDESQPMPLVLNSRADLRDLLIKSGLARAAAEKVAKGGWPALSGEITETDIAEDCAEIARNLAQLMEN